MTADFAKQARCAAKVSPSLGGAPLSRRFAKCWVGDFVAAQCDPSGAPLRDRGYAADPSLRPSRSLLGRDPMRTCLNRQQAIFTEPGSTGQAE